MKNLFHLAAFLFFLAISFSSCSKSIHATGEGIKLDWVLLENTTSPEVRSSAEFTITNTNNSTIDNGWELYFNTIYLPTNVQTNTEGFSIEHLSGDFFKLYASDNNIALEPEKAISIKYSSNRYLLKNSHRPKAPYIVFSGSEVGVPITDYTRTEITLKDHTKNYQPQTNQNLFPTAQNIFEQNKKITILSSENISPIIPTPNSLTKGKGSLQLEDIILFADTNFESELAWFTNCLPSIYTGNIYTTLNNKESNITLLFDASIQGKDAYTLAINESGITLKAASESGMFYALQSLIALLPASRFQDAQDSITFPQISITDQARFSHRGLFLDIARNFQQKEDIFKLIDLMAFYKLNVLQLHLANDEGWRIEIPGIPELTEVGSKRGHASNEKTAIWPYYGSGPDVVNSPFGSGFLSRSDFMEILKYAQSRHVQVIPEVVAPAHMKAAIISMNKRYQHYIAQGDTENAEQYLLVHPADSSDYISVQRYRLNTMDVCMESSYRFYEKVVDEILQMYKETDVPISTFHVGGDEVPRGVWEGSPACQELIAQNEEVTSTADLHNYYYSRISEMLANKGLILAGWEEVGQKVVTENGRSKHIPNQELLGKNLRLHSWNSVVGWGGTDTAYELANLGYDVVLSNSSNLYFDLAYDRDPNEPGLNWSGFVNLKSAWQMTPFNNAFSNDYDIYGKRIDVNEFAKTQIKLTADGQERILGLQGQLWSETINGPEMMFYSLLPKLLGLAERAWAADPEWATTANASERNKAMIKNWNAFTNAVGQNEFNRLDYLFGGFTTRIPKVGAAIIDNKLYANIESPGLEIRYTLDGSEPTLNSPLYQGPLTIENAQTIDTINLRAFTKSGKRSSGITTVVLK